MAGLKYGYCGEILTRETRRVSVEESLAGGAMKALFVDDILQGDRLI